MKLQIHQHFGLWYPKGNKLTLVAYIDVDLAGNINDRISTSGEIFFLGDCLVSWLSKKQYSTSLSIEKEKYIVVGECCTQVLYMDQNLKDVQP